ncbi:MAG: S1 RNA-binding domain-containing protein [Elusimicrobia bacterium]|nr:S1 RNA-binding domain-containing protein [Elusimicrobiota bacterium]
MEQQHEAGSNEGIPEGAPAPDVHAADEGEMTMEALLAQQSATVEKLAEHKVAWVKVIAVTRDAVLVDVGEKNEGSIPLVEFVEDLESPKAPAPTAGQRVPVIKVGSRGGRPSLSHRKAKAELGWELIAKAHADKQRVRGTVSSSVKGGFLVDVQGVQAFLPASLADLRPVRDPKKMVGTGVRCYVIEVNQAKRQLVLSRRAVLEEEAGKRRTRLLDDLRGGEVRIGRIARVSAEGLLVDIGGAEGLVRPQDMAWGKPDPKEFERGQKLKVKVLRKPEKEGEPLQLGIKQLQANPADALKKRFPPKSTVSGKIIEVGAHGVRFQVDPKTVAFVPAAECDTDIVYKPGEVARAIVLGVDFSTFELRASTLRFAEIHDRKRVAQYMKAPPPLTLGQLLSPEKEAE